MIRCVCCGKLAFACCLCRRCYNAARCAGLINGYWHPCRPATDLDARLTAWVLAQEGRAA